MHCFTPILLAKNRNTFRYKYLYCNLWNKLLTHFLPVYLRVYSFGDYWYTDLWVVQCIQYLVLQFKVPFFLL